MINYGSFIASQYLSPAQPLEVSTGVNAGGYIRIVNNSPYQLNVNFNGIGSYPMPEMFLEDFPIGIGYLGKVTITPKINLTNISHATSNLISIILWLPNELQQPQAQPLNQAAVTATASGKPIFSTTVGFGATAHIGQQLNVFNPPNSGVNFTFHSVRVFTNDTTTPTANLMYTSGGDLNFAGGTVPAVSHDGNPNPPVSFSHCTFVDTNVQGFTQTSTIEVLDYPSGVETQDLLAFPDSYILEPGGNLTIQMSSGATGKVVRLTMKWSEDIAVPPQGGVLTGMAITTLVNEGNPLQPVLKATKAGDTPEDVTIMNDGSATFVGRLAVGGLNFPVGSLTRWNVFTGSATNVGNLQAHGLGIKPDFVIFQETGAAGDANTFVWDVAASDATNVKVWTGNATARTYIALAIKL